MPDTSHNPELADELERYVDATGGKKGGVFLARDKRSYIVNIRPRRWSDKHKVSKFWKGKIANLELAKYIADAIYHYCGKPRFHFGNAPLTFPPLSCMGDNGTTAEQRSKYVEFIAGEAFYLQRKAFIQQVMNVIKSQEFILQGERFLNLRNVQVAPHPPPIDEAAADNPSPADEAAAGNPSPTDNPSAGGEAAAAAPSSATDEAAADFPSPTDEAGRDEECESEEFIEERKRFLNLRNVQVAAHPLPIDEVAPDNASPTDEAASDSSSPADETGGDECETPLEDDPEAVAIARGLLASSEVAKVAGFGFNLGMSDAGSSGKILESVEQCYNDFSAVEEEETSNVSPMPPQENQSNIETNLANALLAFQQHEQEIFGSSNQQVNMVSSHESIESPPEDWETDSEGESIEQDIM